MRISVVQMNPGADKAENIAQARRLIGEAVDADRPDIVSLPEVWDSLGGDRAVRNANAELLPAKGSNEPGGPAYEFLRETARATKTHVHGGSIIEQGPEKLFNTTVVFNPDGTEIARYRKMHLFDIIGPRRHRLSREQHLRRRRRGRHLRSRRHQGRLRHLLRHPLPRPVLGPARARRRRHLPARRAFTLATGKDHWEVLIRGRAIETQCWFAAPATWGKHLEGKGEARFTYGHSLICDPWGHVVTKVSDGTGWATARIDPKVTARVQARHAGAGTPETRLNDQPQVAGPARTGRVRARADQLSRRHHADGDRCAEPAGGALWRLPAGPRLGGGRAGRRRLHAGDDPPRAGPPHSGLRHELRLGRLPDEHVRRGRPAADAWPARRRRSCTRCACGR